MAFNDLFTIEKMYIPAPTRRRSGISLPKVRFLVAHDTGNPGSSARSNVQWYIDTCRSVEKDKVSSAHLFVDDKHIYECIPALTAPPEKAWHVLYKKTKDNELYGLNANDGAIGVEYCYGAGIDANKAYHKYLWILAKLCYEFNLNPSTDIVGHCVLDPLRKTDPQTGLHASGRSYAQLLKDVVVAYDGYTNVILEGKPVSANIAAAAEITATGLKVETATTLNLRTGPSRDAKLLSKVAAHTTLIYVEKTITGEPVKGNSTWYKTAKGEWFWDGGLVQI